MGVPGRNPPKNLPPLEDHLRAKFRPDPSSRLDFYREHTDTQTDRHTDIALYVLDNNFLIIFCSDVFPEIDTVYLY